MEFLPTASRTRPRLAVEVRSEDVIAARGDEATQTLMTAVVRKPLQGAAIRPSLRPGNVADAASVSTCVRAALESMATLGKDRSRYITVVIPDTAARVLLLDFDEFPNKPAEALAVVRFRLKKLLPFEVESGVVSYQVMSAARGAIRVLAVAIPCDVLAEYEGVVTAAGYLPGAVLPSTLAALAGVDDPETPALVINAGPEVVTTAIVHGDVVLLHRTIELAGDPLPPEPMRLPSLPLVNLEDSAAEWALQQPLPEYGTADPVVEPEHAAGHFPSYEDSVVAAVNRGVPVTATREVTQAVSVAAAYFEDTLGVPPSTVWVCGSTGADRLREMLEDAGMSHLAVRDLVAPAMLSPNVAASGPGAVSLGRLAGVRGALHG